MLVTKDNVVSICKHSHWAAMAAGWLADKLVAMAVMRSLGRGDWVTVTVATWSRVTLRGQMGQQWGVRVLHLQCFITVKPEKRDDASVQMMT